MEIERAETRIQHLAVALDESAPGSQERADLRVQLADASRSMADLQTTATELIQWARTAPSPDSEHAGPGVVDLEDLTLRERLVDVDPADLSAVGVPAERLSRLLDAPSVPDSPVGSGEGPGAAHGGEAPVVADAAVQDGARTGLGSGGDLPAESFAQRDGEALRLQGSGAATWGESGGQADGAGLSDSGVVTEVAGVLDGVGEADGAGGLDLEVERPERVSPARRGPGKDVSQRPAGWKTMSLSDRAAWLSGRSVRESAREVDENTPKRRR